MKMQTLLAVALSALFHTPKGRDSRRKLSEMIQIKVGKQAAKSEIYYLESEPRCVSLHRDDLSDSSEPRKTGEKGRAKRKRRRESTEDSQDRSETPGKSDQKSRRTGKHAGDDTDRGSIWSREDSEG